MKLSNKMKKIIAKRLTSATAILAVLVLVFACSKNLLVGNKSEISMTSVVNNDSAANTTADIIKDSTGIHVKVNANEQEGVRRIEVLLNDISVGLYNYGGTSTFETEDVAVSIPFGSTSNIKVKANGVLIKDEDVQNMRCISTDADFVAFRNAVNGGNTFVGKYVEVTNDINLSSVCSSSVGSFTPIGATGTNFAGTFNGNYHKISNLYMSTNAYRQLALFVNLQTTSIVENLILDNIYVYNNYTVSSGDTYASGITAVNTGRIMNCGINSGTIYVYNTANRTAWRSCNSRRNCRISNRSNPWML